MDTNSRQANDFICAINVAGLASVMFVLAFLMMYNGALVTAHHDAFGDLPAVSHPTILPNEGREDAMRAWVTRQGDVFFNRDLIKSTDRLPDLIREQVRMGFERRLYVSADARALYGTVKEVVDAVHAAGLEQITFIAEQRRPNQNR